MHMTDSFGNNTTALALGNFDGLHEGHRQVLLDIAKQKENGLTPVLVRFSPHPAFVLHGKAPDRLVNDSVRKKILNTYGIREIVLNFTDICDLSAEEFVTKVLIGQLHAAFVACGFNYRFGKNASASAQDLQLLADQNGLQCSVSPAVLYENEPISATRIRACLKKGCVEHANAMLGRPFSYDFEVVGGDQRGRLMGTPTINQYFPDGFIVPKYGVYASFVELDGVCLPAVTNIGMRPTFNGSSARSETWIMDFSGDLYGQNVSVSLLKHLRDEVKFDNMDALRDQILSDAKASRTAVESFLKKVEKI